ncbi:MAG: CHRD domain-containing protein [Flavobacterium sp.]
MKHLFIFLAIFLISPSIVSYNDEEPINSNVTFKAVLDDGNQATGTAVLTFNATTKIFSLTVTFIGGAATSGQIYNEGSGSNEQFVFPLSDLTSPITYTSFALDAAQEASLNANLYRISLKNSAYPYGEISGMLIKEGTAVGDVGSPPPPPGLNK